MNLKDIAKEYDIMLRFVDDKYLEEAGLEGCREFYFKNRSYVCGNEVILGDYDNEELRTVSFFYELGHICDDNDYDNKYEQENGAWKVGFDLAKKHDIVFCEETLKWCREQLETYRK